VLLLAVLPLGYFYGGTIVRFATNKGQIVIEAEDGMEVTVKEKGADSTPKGSGDHTTAGEHELDVTVGCFRRDPVLHEAVHPQPRRQADRGRPEGVGCEVGGGWQARPPGG
jgi:hypothetical protein